MLIRILARRFFPVFFVLAICGATATAAEKPNAALNPNPVVVGVSDTEVKMIMAPLRESLGRYYSLITERAYNEAWEKFREEVESMEECTEDSCIQYMQDSLAISHVFVFMIIRQRDLTQLTLELAKLDVKFTSTVSCNQCDVGRLLDQVGPLVSKMVEQDSEVDAGFSLSGDIFAKTAGPSADGIRGGVERLTPQVTGDSRASIALLVFKSEPSGADVYINDTLAGKTPYQNMSLKPGTTLRITLKLDGYYDKQVEFMVEAGTNKIEQPIMLVSKYGKLNITSDPEGAEVFLAGNRVGKTPYRDDHILSNKYLLSLRLPLHFPIENQTIEVKDADQTVSQHFRLLPNFGELEIRTEPDNVSIVITDQEGEVVKRAESPLDHKIIPGNYNVRLTKEGYESLDFKAGVARGKKVEIRETLRKLEGTLIVSCEPYMEDAEVYVDDEYKGKVPVALVVPAGERNIRVQTDYKIGYQIVTVIDRQTATAKVLMGERLSEREILFQYNRWKAKWMASAGGALLAAYWAMQEHSAALSAKSDQDAAVSKMMAAASYAEASAYSSEASSKGDEIKQHNGNVQVGILGSAVLAGLATWIWLDEPAKPRTASLRERNHDAGSRFAWQPYIQADGRVGFAWQVKW
ncbi:PEGA domain-containing protein [bacterium]|nr:PEGA domain-containing protein [bacterium]